MCIFSSLLPTLKVQSDFRALLKISFTQNELFTNELKFRIKEDKKVCEKFFLDGEYF